MNAPVDPPIVNTAVDTAPDITIAVANELATVIDVPEVLSPVTTDLDAVVGLVTTEIVQSVVSRVAPTVTPVR